MEFLKDFIEKKLTVEERVKLIKELMDVEMIYEEIEDYVLDNLVGGEDVDV